MHVLTRLHSRSQLLKPQLFTIAHQIHWITQWNVNSLWVHNILICNQPSHPVPQRWCLNGLRSAISGQERVLYFEKWTPSHTFPHRKNRYTSLPVLWQEACIVSGDLSQKQSNHNYAIISLVIKLEPFS